MGNELRSAGNKVSITGVLLEHKLKEQKGDKGKYINGSFVIKAGKFTEIDVKVFVDEKTKEGKEREAFTLLKQILNDELPTLAKDKENATILSIYGNKDFQPKLKEERYADKTNTNVNTKLSVDLGFGKIKVANDTEEEDFKAGFDIELFVTSVEDEVDKEEEPTGRVKVKGYVPTYGGGIFPIELIAGIIVDEEGEFDFAEEVRSEIEEGSTINVWGDINFAKIVEKKSKGGKLGRAKIEESSTYIHELIANGADIIEDDKYIYEEDEIEKAVKERKIQLDEVLTKAKAKESGEKTKTKGIGNKTTKTSTKDTDSDDKPKKRSINF